jgi:hypothetical protein
MAHGPWQISYKHSGLSSVPILVNRNMAMQIGPPIGTGYTLKWTIAHPQTGEIYSQDSFQLTQPPLP